MRPDESGPSENRVPTVQRGEPLYVDAGRLWGSTIPVCWENPVAGNATERSWVQDAIADSWELVIRSRFTGWGACTSGFNGLRIRINDEASHTKGLGTALRGKSAGMVLNFTFARWNTDCQSTREACIRVIATHEFGHALGFAHEQNRPDTPEGCDAASGSNGTETWGDWDADSVMNYCNPVWDDYGRLSNGDIRGAQSYYGARTSHVLAGNFDGNGRADAFVYAPGSGRAWLSLANGVGNPIPACTGGEGFNGYDFWDFNDKALVFDYDGNGWDDLFFYRPGGGIAYVMRSNGNGTFTTVQASSTALGGFDMWDVRDLAVRLDYNGDNLDDLFMYRRGTGTVYVARSNGNGTFTTAFASSYGFGGYAMNGASDQVLVFDYNGDHREDLFVYRPGHGVAAVTRSNGDGTFTSVYASSRGFAGFDLLDPGDQVLVFDYNGDHLDDLLLYRPGHAVAYVARSNGDGTFTTVSASSNGIGGFDLWDPRDHVTAFDSNGDGRDDLFLYRAGGGVGYVARSNGDGTFTPTFASQTGVGSFNLKYESDRAIALDANGGGLEDVLLFREDLQAGQVAFSMTSGGLFTGPCMNACSADCSL